MDLTQVLCEVLLGTKQRREVLKELGESRMGTFEMGIV